MKITPPKNKLPTDDEIHNEAFRRQEEILNSTTGAFEFSMDDFKAGADYIKDIITQRESMIASLIRCRDCRYIFTYPHGKIERHRCSNPKSKRFGQKYQGVTIGMDDMACHEFHR